MKQSILSGYKLTFQDWKPRPSCSIIGLGHQENFPAHIFKVRYYIQLYIYMWKKWSELIQSCPTLCNPMDTRLLRPWDFLGKSIGVGCRFLLQGTSWPRDRTQVSHIVDRHFPSEPPLDLSQKAEKRYIYNRL